MNFCYFIKLYDTVFFKVRRRASNQSTEAAASNISAFLELNGDEESSDGWMLISTINLLAAEGETLVEVSYGYLTQLKIG